MIISQKLTNYSAYKDGTDFLGTTDITLPSIEAMTDTISGAGIAGEIDTPTIGHFGSMTVGLNWRTVDTPTIELLKQKAHSLDFRGNMQAYDPAKGETKDVGVKITVKAIPKKADLGKFAVASTTDSSNELEVTYIKIIIDGKTVLEIDKYNFICVIDGEDQLENVRKNLSI
ncbi:phage major tail tube protein [Chengkuizengella axinellae]|uniref:Phage major tail tube protein n=1 Tax=Chengkuizengella axinellae TaxID=3064388 RepID=A0ABT9J6G7_9BACL|nr:phage major tail tube protein [Chengkuizengella sp. 2205SS18-9]MDP5277143.1 phage major tail tube protein [Chengkuizengella sp. 2205SS18-9]